MNNKDFAELVETAAGAAQPFKPFASYDPDGDCIEFIARPDSYWAERVDGRITVYRSDEDNEIIGTQIKGVSRLLKQHAGLLAIEIEDGKVRLKHLLRAHFWPSVNPRELVTVLLYKKLIELAERTETEVSLEACGAA